MQLKNGDIFAEHYQLKKLLGVGSFGEVWLARNILADVDVAIKLYGLLDDNGIKDFREEFKLAYKLHHPNLLHLNHHEAGFHPVRSECRVPAKQKETSEKQIQVRPQHPFREFPRRRSGMFSGRARRRRQAMCPYV